MIKFGPGPRLGQKSLRLFRIEVPGQGVVSVQTTSLREARKAAGVPIGKKRDAQASHKPRSCKKAL